VDDGRRNEDEARLRVQLDVQLDAQPIQGRLEAEDGTEEVFVGWLGFVDALRRLRDAQPPRT
jgi:hypothetical protein